MVDTVLGKGSFAVDEDFVKANLAGLSDKDRDLMQKFVEQSLQEDEEKDEKDDSVVVVSKTRVRKALFRISGPRSAVCDDSPLFEGIFHNSGTRVKGDFSGRLIQTDGNRATKLTKIFKRRDNKGTLYETLRRMQLE